MCYFLSYFLVRQSGIQFHKSWKICSISWVNHHLTDLAFCQLIWTEKGAASAKNAFDSLFIYLNWSAVIKSSVSHYSLLERSGVLPFAKIFEWLGPRHGPCQSDGKHSLCLLDSLKCCCKSLLPVHGARPSLHFENFPLPEHTTEQQDSAKTVDLWWSLFLAWPVIAAKQLFWLFFYLKMQLVKQIETWLNLRRLI